jgi:hypothetical protein
LPTVFAEILCKPVLFHDFGRPNAGRQAQSTYLRFGLRERAIKGRTSGGKERRADTGMTMRIVDFNNFSRRRLEKQAGLSTNTTAHERAAAPRIDYAALDPWAARHQPEQASAEIVELPIEDFWGDLAFRMAYPTHRLREH